MTKTRDHRRLPKRTEGFAWGRFTTDDGSAITWRLYRGDHCRAMHVHAEPFIAHEDCAVIASRIRRARRHLRDKVDDRAMEVAA